MFAVYTLALFFFILHEHSGCVNSAVTWSACDSSVLAQFKSYFPDYVPPASGRRRAETGSMRSESNGNGFDRSNHEIFKMFKTKSSPWVLNDKMAKPREGENRLFALNHYLYEEESKDDKDGTTRKIKFKSHNPRFSLFNNKPPFVKDRRKLATTPCTDCSLGCCTVSDIELRCGIVPVPKSYPAASPTMDIRVYHIRVIGAAAPTDAANRKHLWLLQGGPGGSGASLMFLALSAMQYATDVYIPDHRGTGDSSSLECPGQETSISSGGSDITSTEVQPCYNYCLQLNQNWDDFTTTNAAKDLNEVIVAVYNDATVKPKSTTVHGYSYGTRWLSRYLQVFPNVGNIVTNIILEGNVMNETVFNDFPLGMQSVGDRLLDKCALETTCSEKIKSITSPTSTPKQAFQEMIDDILAGATSTTTNKCTIVIGGSQPNKADTLAYIQQLLQSGITYGIQYAGDKNEIAIDFRAITISMIYRWYKCKTQPDVHLKPFTFMVVFMIHIGGGSLGGLSIDKNVLNKVKEDIDRPTLLDVDEVESNVLYYLIRYSELWRYPMPSQSQYSATFDKVVFGYVDDFTYLKSVAETYLQGYVYPKDAYVTGLTAQNVAANVLIINGELDGQTPYKDAQTQFQRTSTASGKEKILAVIPNGGHGTTDHGCGEEVLRLFSNGQYAEAKTKISQCALQNTVPTLGTWDLDAKYSKVISGSEKMWDGSIDGSTCKSFSLPSGSTCYNPSGTFSSSVISQCIQCFDYCLLAASGNNEDLCTCVADLRACTNTALCSQSQEVCEQVRDIYAKQLFTGATVTQFSKCPCVASISQTAVIGIAVGVAAAALVIGAVIFFVVRRRRNNTQSFQNMQQRV